MKKCSTSETPVMPQSDTRTAERAELRPGKLAIEFIRRFARSYHYEPRLASLGSMNIN